MYPENQAQKFQQGCVSALPVQHAVPIRAHATRVSYDVKFPGPEQGGGDIDEGTSPDGSNPPTAEVSHGQVRVAIAVYIHTPGHGVTKCRR